MKTSALNTVLAFAITVGAAASWSGPTVPPCVAPLRPTMSLDIARQAIDGAIEEAGRLDAGGCIAVVDDGGYLVCLVRLDDTFPAAAEVATLKARTAAIFRKPTQDFENAIKSGRTPLLGVDAMTPLEGGAPIRANGVVIGAIGVSGAHSSTEDVQIAAAGASAINLSTAN